MFVYTSTTCIRAGDRKFISFFARIIKILFLNKKTNIFDNILKIYLQFLKQTISDKSDFEF